jgi:hypothetical protein
MDMNKNSEYPFVFSMIIKMEVNMLFKDDWDKSKQRLEALWNNEIIDRACISVTALKDSHNYVREKMPESPEDLFHYFTDGEWVHKRQMHRFENTYFGGEAHPVLWTNFGTAGHAKYFKNAKFSFSKDTVWYEASMEDGEIPEYIGDDSILKVEKECMRYLSKEGMGKYFVSVPDNCGIIDALEHLRGSSDLLFDLIDNPDWVKQCIEAIYDGYIQSSEEIFDIIRENNEGGSAHGWMNTWSPGKHQHLQVDFSVMISPDMFEEFAMIELERATQWLDHSIYHLDGQEQIRHLDMILSLEKLNMIQWTPVASQPPTSDFIPVLKRIQEAGKGLILFPKKHELKILLEELSPKGLHLIVNDAENETEARDIVKFVEKMSCKR